MLNSFDELDLTRRTRIDALCREYEDAWYNDTEPHVSAFVERVPPEDIDDCLRELLATDFELRLAEKRDIPLETLLNQFPTHADLIERVYFEVLDEALSAPPQSSDSKVGTQIGDFQLLRELGRGGMGIVYEALQTSLQRHVALKVLPPSGQQDPARIARFSREARAIARLHHEHIVDVYGVGEADGTHFIAMQFVSGESLDRLLAKADRRREFCESTFGSTKILHATSSQWNSGERQGASRRSEGQSADAAKRNPGLAPTGSQRADTEINFAPEFGATQQERFRNVARIGQQMAAALSYAHSQGVLHRDVKPSNILLDDRGSAWLTDFGLAKVAETNTALTESGNVIGTIKYLAPESMSGQTDQRSDLYSLGLTLYELLSGRAAFDAPDRAELFNLILTKEAPELSKLVSSAPRDLITIIHKSIEREPDQRYQTANELADDLQRYLNDEPIRARPISNLERFARWSRRNKLLSFLLLTTFVLLSVGLIGSVIANVHFKQLEGEQRQLAGEKGLLADRNEKLATEQTRLAEQNGKLARDAQEERDRSTLLLSDVLAKQGLEAAESGKEREALVLFAGSAEKCQPLDTQRYRANVTRFNAVSQQMATLERLCWWGKGHWTLSYAVHPQGLAVVQRDRDMKHCALFDLTTGREIQIPLSGAEIGGIAWSVDGQRLFVGSVGRVTSFRFPQMDEPQVIDNVASTPSLVQWLVPDPLGRYVAIACGTHWRLWHIERREFLGPSLSQAHPIREFVFSSDSEWLISVNAGNQFQAFATKDFSSSEVAPAPKFVGLHFMNEYAARALPTFLRRNSTLLTFPQPLQLELRNLARPNEPRNVPQGQGYVVAVEPLSDELFFMGGNNGGSLLRLGEGLQPVIEPVKETVGEVFSASFNSQRNELLVGYANRDTQRWQLPEFKPLPFQFTTSTGCFSIVPSPDTKRLITSGLNDGHFCVWQLPTDSPQPDVADLSTGHRRAAFSNDSRYLAIADASLKIAIHDLMTQQRVRTIELSPPHSPAATVVPLFLPDNERLAGMVFLSPELRELRVWNWRTGTLLQTVTVPTAATAPYEAQMQLTASRQQMLVSQGKLGTALWFELTDQELVSHKIADEKCSAIFGISPDGQWIAGTRDENSFILLPRQSPSVDNAKNPIVLRASDTGLRMDFQFSSDQKRVAACFKNAKVLVWDISQSPATTSQVNPLVTLGHPAGLHYSEFSADNRHLLTVCRTATAQVWELPSGRLVGAPFTGSNDIGATFRPHHDELLTVDHAGQFNVWDWRSTVKLWPARQPVHNPALVWPHFRTLTLSPNGRFAAVGGFGELALIDLSPLDVTTLLSPAGLRRQAEVISGLRSLDNGGTAKLNSQEWLNRLPRSATESGSH